jgi:hypothetical protein
MQQAILFYVDNASWTVPLTIAVGGAAIDFAGHFLPGKYQSKLIALGKKAGEKLNDLKDMRAGR